MAVINSDYKIDDKKLSYSIENDGYYIYLDGQVWIHQYEPYIPNHTKSYEENALAQIKELYESSVANHEPTTEERLADLELLVAEMIGGTTA